MIQDYMHTQVRLARSDATDIGQASGYFDGVVSGQVIIVSGRNLVAMDRTGTVRKLGQLAGDALWGGPGTVAVNPGLSQWIYTVYDQSLTSFIHLGWATGDCLLATVPSPDGSFIYQPITWNASGAYVVKQGVGLGGAGPFLEYHFPLARLNLTTGQVTVVSPTCIAQQVLEDGTMLCRVAGPGGGSVEIRAPSGASHVIQMSSGTTGTNGVYTRLSVSADARRLIAARNGSKDPVINYQVAMANVTESNASAFGPIDFVPDTWLPDGRVVAEHMCVDPQWGGGACDQSQDATYFVSADGNSKTLFYKLAGGSYVVAYV